MARAIPWVVSLVAGAVVVVVGGEAPGSAVAELDYVDSSVGLSPPELDGGDTEFEMGDVDGDGRVDLVSVGDHGNPLINTDQEGIMVWFGDGQGNWTHTQSGHLGYGGVALGDVNGDGLVDVGYGIHHDYSSTDLGDQLLEVALGDGTGLAWTPWDDGLADEGQSWGLLATDFADVDGDGDLDVGSMGFGASDGLQIYLNERDGTWDRSFGFLGGNSSHVFVFGDVNGDGHPDVGTAKEEGTVWLNDGEGFLQVADGNLPPTSFLRRGPDLGDVDEDGRDDLSYCDGSGDAQVWLWRGDDVWEDASAGLPAVTTCQHTQLHDMNGDGSVDLVTFGEGRVRIFAGDGAGEAWTEISSFTTPDSPGDSQAFRVGGDVDHNGMPDMVLVNTKQISFFEDRNVAHVYRETTAPSTLSVRIVRPGPSRRLHAGSIGFVDWASEVPPGQSSTVKVELSTSGPSGPWTLVADGLPNNGRHQWRVPLAPSGDARVRITVTTATDAQVQAVSDRPFTIARRPDPTVITFTGAADLEIDDGLGRDRVNVYRADRDRFLATGEYTQDPAEVAGAARFCDLETSSLTDAAVPAPGEGFWYLATGYRRMEDGQQPGVEVAMAEGTLGQDSAAETRSNAHPCPR